MAIINALKEETIKATQKALIFACSLSIWYFIVYFCKTEDPHDPDNPVKGIPAKDYLKYVMKIWCRYKVLCIIKSRQMLITWIMLACHLWIALFKKSQLIFIQCQDMDNAEELVERLHFIYDHLPKFIKEYCPITKYIQKEIRFSNRSRVIALAKGGHQIRQKAASAIMSDEFAFQEEGDESYRAMRPTITGGGRLTLISSAETGYYCELVHDRVGFNDTRGDEEHMSLAEVLMRGMKFWTNKNNKLPVLELKYIADPDKDPERDGKAWYEEARSGVDEADWEREMEINWYVRSGKRFYGEFKREYIKELQVDRSQPIYRAWDFGHHHPACVWFQFSEKDKVNGMPRIYVLRELMGSEITIQKFIPLVLKEFANVKDVNGGKIRFIDCCDAAGTQKNDKSEHTSIDFMIKAGLRPRFLKKGIKPGCDIVRNAIERGQLITDVTCKVLNEGFLGGFVYPKYRPGMSKEESELPEAGSFYSHLMDCVRYFCVNFLNVIGIQQGSKRDHKTRTRVYGAGNKKYTERQWKNYSQIAS